MKKRLLVLTKSEKREVLKKLGLLILVSVLLGIVYELHIAAIAIVLAFTVIMVPKFYSEHKKEIQMKNRYDSVVLYLEQMLYSFKKRPKIREALIDAQKTSENSMKELIEEVVVNIDTKMNDNIYEDSLQIIEEEYPCRKMKSVHEFVVKIENQGGEYERYLNILLDDIKIWNDRTGMLIQDMKRIKRNILISIGATMTTCAFMTKIVPEDYVYTDKLIYQISTIIMIVLMELIYYIVIKKLNFDWLQDVKGAKSEIIDRYYQILKHAEEREPDNWLARSNYKTAKKRLEMEIMRSFPDWLRETAVNLQVETVQSAIEHSYDNAPYVLKEPIRKMLLDFEDYPVGIEPYDNFLKELDIHEIKSSMKMLYSMGELGKEEAEIQIGSIIDRNIKLENQAEELKNRDRVGIASFISVVPMMLGVVKIMIDMLLMIFVFTSALSNVMQVM